MTSHEDYDTDDILDKLSKKKTKKNSKDKGNRGERALVKLLNERFNSSDFSRSIGSGNRWSQVESVHRDFIGDLMTPKDFRFVIECKFGYSDIDLCLALSGNVLQIDNFLKQSKKDAERANREPLLLWKKDRQPWIAFVYTEILSNKFSYQMYYKEWTALSLSQLLEMPNDFFFCSI